MPASRCWRPSIGSSSRRWIATLAKAVRLDTELVRRSLVASREEAKRAIQMGAVIVNGVPARSPATLVVPDAAVTLSADPSPFVSRGGIKLDGALRRFRVRVEGRKWLDAGSSTGGFTDRLLQGGAVAVAAVDVGYGQLDWRIRNDERVVVLERTNVRNLTRADLPWAPDGIVADLSFISLTLVLPALRAVARRDADFVLLVKPQFEVGAEAVGKGGVVRDPALWQAAMERVAGAGAAEGLAMVDAAPSVLTGPAGNREFFIHLRAAAQPDPDAIEGALRDAT
jgi:23S rRNA (cytidine1920-2'-O)/16S rRNA (cytidine1409-2'-O)-methyltransferase